MKTGNAAPKGMRDFGPAEHALREHVLQTILRAYARYGFNRLETSVLNDLSVLTGSRGGENEKLIFKVLKRGNKLRISENATENSLADLGLRFDLTVPLCRFYAGRRAELPLPFKSVQAAPVWRAERPQKGRFRQFMQCDADVIGEKSVTAECELIAAVTDALSDLGFSEYILRINDRRILEKLAEFSGFAPTDTDKIFISLDKIDKIGWQGVYEDLVSQGFSVAAVGKLLEAAKFSQTGKVPSFLSNIVPEDCLKDLEFVIKTAESRSNGRYQIKYDLTLVRGMGYYTGQIFEIEIPGYGSSVAGGGRYDQMIGRHLKNEEVPAAGFSIGFERIVQILSEQAADLESRKIVIVHEPADYLAASETAEKLRAQKYEVGMASPQRNRRAQLQLFAENGYAGFVLFRPDSANDVKLFD